MRFSRPLGCLKYRNRIGGDIICGVTSRRHLMIELEGPNVESCVQHLQNCDIVAKAAEIAAITINEYFTQNKIRDRGYLISKTETSIHILSLTKILNKELLELIEVILNTLNELENTELKDAVETFDRRYLQMCLNRKMCTLRYSAKGERPPPEPIAIIRPDELAANYKYRFLWSIVEPFERNLIVKTKKYFTWP